MLSVELELSFCSDLAVELLSAAGRPELTLNEALNKLASSFSAVLACRFWLQQYWNGYWMEYWYNHS